MGVKDCIDCDKKKAEVECNCIPVENADGTLQTVVLGCTDSTAINYNALANCDDGSCVDKVSGCMNPASLNYSPCFNADCAGNLPGSTAYIAAGIYGDVSCCCSVAGCMDSNASNYNSNACIDNGSCSYPGCMDPTGCNYDPSATVSDGSCTYPPTATETATSCDSYVWSKDGQTYTTSGTYTHVTSGSCPTTTTLTLTINSATTSTDTRTECISYTWPENGTSYTTGGTYVETSTNAAGCTHTATLNLTIQPAGCTDATATNFDPSAICDDGSCAACIYGCMDATANNYNAGATCDDGSCSFCVYGCSDPAACNYNASTTCEAVGTQGTGECEFPTTQDLGEASYGKETPNYLSPAGDGAHEKGKTTSLYFPCTSHAIAAFPYETGVDAFGAHMTKTSGSLALNGSTTANTASVYSETYFFEATNLTSGNNYCINWAEIVLALRHSQCCDCLMGGWWFKMDTGTGSPSWTDINNATSIYDPVTGVVPTGTSPGTLTTASPCYQALKNPVPSGSTGPPAQQYALSDYVVECATNVPGNPGNKNTAGASNGSCSEWNEKCITFTATATAHRIHAIAVTDLDLCLTCHCGKSSSKRGTYVGISKVMISTDGCTAGNCSC